MPQGRDKAFKEESQAAQLFMQFVEGGLTGIKRSKVTFQHHALAERKSGPASAHHSQLVTLDIDFCKDWRCQGEIPSRHVQLSQLDDDLLLYCGVRPGLEVCGQHLLQRRRVAKTRNPQLLFAFVIADSQIYRLQTRN